ncbi:MAG: hypothetical protein HYV03_01120 [Deltaproteobacteria bacterium]|nr:hypothetical protein [Deltaproteobacteria bacterium]
MDILKTHGFDLLKRLVPPQIIFTSFEEYHPPSAPEALSFGDPFFEHYFTTNPSSLETWDECCHAGAKGSLTDPIRIQNMDTFRLNVLATAKELGATKEQIARMSIHDAALLTGRITRHRLSYNHAMIGEPEKAFDNAMRNDPNAIQKVIVMGLEGKSPETSPEAQRIDQLPHDAIFAGGLGICRNYAQVNAAVYRVLKEWNPNLRNTYMTSYSLEDPDSSLALPHAWNMVSALIPDGINITFVDPTWFDTRSRTATGDPTKQDAHLSDEAAYNAYDPAHFRRGQHLAQGYVAQLFEFAADEHRLRLESGNPFATNADVITVYKARAFEQRLIQTQTLLALSQQAESEETRSAFRRRTAEALHLALCNILPVPPSVFVQYGPAETGYREPPPQMKEFFSLYEKIKQQDPTILSLEIRGPGDVAAVTIEQIYSRIPK